MTTNLPRFFFTAPWEPVPVRRGDALGMGALADQFADAVAPELSNRASDGRWVTLLAWSLVQSQQVFHASGGRSVMTRSEKIQRYGWLRPLELMWVARSISLLDKDNWTQRPLPGQRRVEPWLATMQKADRFGMTPEQFRAYRQTGSYGGYRRAFRKWPGLTTGDGWTPGPRSIALANWLNEKLKGAGLQLDDDLGRSAKLGRGKEHRWWLTHWSAFNQASKDAEFNTLPRQRTDFSVLPEVHLLKPTLFGNDTAGKKRLAIVQSVARSKATTPESLYHYLSQQFKDDPTIVRLAAFSRLADAGLAAMDLVAEVLQRQPEVALTEITQHSAAKDICKALYAAALAWLALPEMTLRHAEAAGRFARSIMTDQPIMCLRQLLRHHEAYGGGLRWFVLCNERVEARTPLTSAASRYGFRLWALCRLGVQCGVIATMPKALHDETDWEDKDE